MGDGAVRACTITPDDPRRDPLQCAIGCDDCKWSDELPGALSAAPPRVRHRHSRAAVRAAARRARERARRRVERWGTWAYLRNPIRNIAPGGPLGGDPDVLQARCIRELTSDRVPRAYTPPRGWDSGTQALSPAERRLREWDAADTDDALGPAQEQPEWVWWRDDDDRYAELHAIVAGTYPILYDTGDPRSRA